MEISPEESNNSVEFGGEVYHFCSASCKEKFEKNPTEYARTRPVGHDHSEHGMHFGGCCGVGGSGGWMGYIHLAIMIAFFLLLLLSR